MLETLLNRLRGQFQDGTLPTVAAEIGDYRENFERAVIFTRSCGIAMDAPEWLERDVLDLGGTFIEPSFRAAGVVDPGMAAGQCLKWCHYLAPYIEHEIGAKVWVTIGQLWKGDRTVFSPKWSDLRRWSKAGISLDDLQNEGRGGINLHAWLTAQSGEIIDPTFLSSLAEFGHESFADMRGAVVWGRDPKVLNRHRYLPMAVGAKYAEAINRDPRLPLLAFDPTTLHQMQVAISVF